MIDAPWIVRLVGLVTLAIGVILTGDELDALFVLAALSLICLDLRTPTGARNVILAYNLLVLGVGPVLFPVAEGRNVQWLGVGLVAAFIVGVGAATVLRQPVASSERASDAYVTPAYPAANASGTAFLKFAIFLQVAIVAFDMVQFGVAGYLSGASLVAKLSSFAAGGLSGGDVLKEIVEVLVVGSVAAHVASNEPHRRYAWRLLILALIVLPLARLDRSFLISSLLVLLFLHRASVGPRRRRASGHAVVAMSILLSVGLALGIGVLRQGAIAGGGAQVTSASGVLIGEVSPVLVVADAISPGAPRFGGEPLGQSLLTRYVPRAIYPDKPLNTAARWMALRDPASFAAGYSIAPTAVGALILNFGTGSAFAGAFTAGAAVKLLSRRNGKGAPLICISYFALLSLLRDDPSSSLAYVLACVVAYRALMLSTKRSNRAVIAA